MDTLFATLQAVARELALFAGFGFAAFALDEFVVDLLWIGRAMWRHFIVFSERHPATAETLARTGAPGRIAVFIPAWDEAVVIGEMLSWAARAYAGQDCDIFVGCYPNDPATLAVVGDRQCEWIHRVVCSLPGPTTKADCLNHAWLAMQERETRRGFRYKGVVLHDAEDMVSAREMGIFGPLLDRFDLIQLPVIPAIDPRSRFIAGHYCDEFAEAHGKTLVVREMLGAAVPSAGVGCALGRAMLDTLAGQNDDALPFNIDSLTEDYELGLHIKALGGRTVFVRLSSDLDSQIVGTRAHFPTTIETAVRQKARWMTGISLAGWDRLGWRGGAGEIWMRWRDRRAIFAALLIVAGYLALLMFLILMALAWFRPFSLAPIAPILAILMRINAVALLWRFAVRAYFVHQSYGVREAVLSVVRIPVANFIAVMAAKRAITRYWTMLQSGKVVWDKTVHQFPTAMERIP